MPATVTARAIPASLSPERERLAAAIARYDEAVAYRDRVNKVADDAQAAAMPLYRQLDEATTALEIAKSNAPRLRLASLMGDAINEITPEEAAVALDEARAAIEARRRDRELISAELSRADAAVDAARRRRDEAVNAVLKAEPAVPALLAEFHVANRRVETIRHALRGLTLALPQWWDSIPANGWQPDPAMAEAWSAALAALQTDASAPLPGDDAEPQPLDAA